MPAVVATDALPVSEPVIATGSLALAEITPAWGGSFVDTPSHPGGGAVAVYEIAGARTLRLSEFTTTAGPDLFVYLSRDTEATEFVNLGELRALAGDLNYEVPGGVEFTEYPYVLIWCKRFGVLFMSAKLSPTATPEASAATTSGAIDDAEMVVLTETANVPVLSLVATPAVREPVLATALFGNGCFWCVESDMEKVAGVVSVVSGFAGGRAASPSYQNYADSGHREVVLVTYDANVVSYANLVEHILKHGDPTDAGGSFKDRGVEYAPALYYETEVEAAAARAVVQAVDAVGIFPAPLPIPVLPRPAFYPAEGYHQDYAKKNPLKYSLYRTASGRSAFIERTWGDDATAFTYSVNLTTNASVSMNTPYTLTSWTTYVRPDDVTLRAQLSGLAYKVTRQDGTERAGSSPLDKNYEPGIYVDIISGEPLFSSRDKYDSGTGWPSFVRPISDEAVTFHEDRRLFSVRTEVRSRYADSHLGHVFDDGPADRGGKRYCMNGAALRFIPQGEMAVAGYAAWLSMVE
jgi:peptide methionine sulfoxide reductase msrA/msrB